MTTRGSSVWPFLISWTMVMSATNPLRIGARGTNDRFTGRLAEFIVYDRVLDSEEVTAVYGYLDEKWDLGVT